jgi:sulfoxide reductase heme-binding subunit YedZ
MKRPRLTPLQILVHVAAWVPLLVLIFDFLTNNLTVNPYQASQRRTGNIAITLLILSLACTPINTLFKVPAINKLRRPLGLYAYMYAAIHLFIFTGLDYGFDFNLILLEVAEKRFVLAGLSAFVLLSLLALTSFRWWMVRMGKKWKNLHRLVYLANLLVVLHFAWAVKGDVLRLQGDILRPLVALVIVLSLLIMRIPAVRRRLAGRLQPVGALFQKAKQPPPRRAKPAEVDPAESRDFRLEN